MSPPWPLALVRIAALPSAALEAFACPAARAQLERAERVFARLEARRLARCDALHALVPRLEGAARRGALALRRAVHNHRPAPPVDAELTAALGRAPGLGDELAAWRGEVAAYHEACRLGQRALQASRAECGAALRQVWRDELLQRGVLHAQPELFRELEQALAPASAARQPRARDSRWQLSLLAYVYRAASKTSPFSALTVTALGQPVEREPASAALEAGELCSQVVLDPALVEALARRWLASPPLAALAPLVAPVLAEVDGDRVTFLHAPADGGPEALRTLLDAPLAALALRVRRELPASCPRDELARALAALLGCAPAALAPLGCQLEELGALAPALDFDAGRPGALAALVTAVDAVVAAADGSAEGAAGAEGREAGAGSADGEPVGGAEGAEAAALGDELARARQVAAHLAAGPWRPARRQAEVLGEVERELRGLLGERVRSGKAVFERCSLARPVELPAASLRALEPSLARLLAVLPLFNVEHGADVVVQEALRERCAGGAVLSPLAAFSLVCEHAAAVVGATQAPGDAFLHAAKLREAASPATGWRDAWIDELRARCVGAAAGAREVEVPDELWARGAELARPLAPRHVAASATVLGQLIDTGDPARPRLALNGVVSGYGALAAAWAGARDRGPAGAALGEQLAARLRALAPEAEVVEVAAALGFGGQVRAPLTPRALRYPGHPMAAGAARLEWAELGVTFDARLGRAVLVHRASGRRVVPVHLGTLSPAHLPPFYRFALALGPCFTPTFSPVELFEATAPAPTPRRYPRITAGPLVLARETWCVAAAHLPRFAAAWPAFDELLTLRRWARALGLPRQVFVTCAQIVDLANGEVGLDVARRAHKPFLLDLDDPTSCALFARFTRTVGPTVRLTEMLPTPAQRPASDGGRAVELALELQAEAWR